MILFNTLYQSLPHVSGEFHAGGVGWDYFWEYLYFIEPDIVYYGSIGTQNYDEIIDLINNLENKSISHSYSFEKYKFHLNRYIIEVDLGEMQITGCEVKEGKIVLNHSKTDMWDLYTPVKI